MKSQNNMRLCGGTFLVLLFEARGTRRNSRMGEGRMSDGKSNTEIFKRLIYATNPYFQMPSGRSFNTFTSDYKIAENLILFRLILLTIQSFSSLMLLLKQTITNMSEYFIIYLKTLLVGKPKVLGLLRHL